MDKPSKNKQHVVAKKDKASIFDSWAMDAAGVAITGVSAVVAAAFSIGSNFYKNMSRYGAFRDIQEKRDEGYRKVYREHVINPKTDGEQMIHEINAIEKQYAGALKERLDHFGIKGTMGKWRTLKHHQKVEVALTGAAVAAVSLGAVVNLVGNRRVSAKQAELEQQLGNQDDKQR